MHKILDVVVIAGFVVVDLFLFHDLFKGGEIYTFVDYLVGALSVVVMLRAIHSLMSDTVRDSI